MADQKEIDQELGIKRAGTYKGLSLSYIMHEHEGEEIRVFMRNEPERIKNDQVEETREEYKYRRNMMKFAQKKRNRLMWNSSDMGTYKKQTVQQVEEKYKELKKDDKMEEALLKMDENLQKENLQKEA